MIIFKIYAIMKKFLPIIPFVLLLIFVGCSGSSTTVTLSNVARVTAFGFYANDSFPGLAKARFTVEELTDTGLIAVVDSIQYGTPLDSVRPRVVFYTTPAAAILHFGKEDEQKYLSGNGMDTVDFTKSPALLEVYSQDKSTIKWYRIKVYAHTVDPDLFHWNRLTPAICPTVPAEQKAIKLGSTFCFYTNNGFTNKLYMSQDAVQWTEKQVSGALPADCHVSGIVSDGQKLYYCDSSAVYVSADGIVWRQLRDCSADRYVPVTFVMHFNGLLWGIVRGADRVHQLATLNPDGEFVVQDVFDEGHVPSTFPVSDFAVVQFTSASSHPHILIAGGYNYDGEMLNSRWSVEYNQVREEYRMVNYATEQSGTAPFAGLAMAWYDNRLYAFGGLTENGFYPDDIRVSDDEGLHWVAADTAHNVLPNTFQKRQRVTALTDGDYIYLFGGQSATQTYTDVYRGKINSINW